MADTLEGMAAAQGDPERLEEGVDSSLSTNESESCSCVTRMVATKQSRRR